MRLTLIILNMNSRFIISRCQFMLSAKRGAFLPWSTYALVKSDFNPKCVCFRTATARPAEQLKRNNVIRDCYRVLKLEPKQNGLEEVKEAFLRLAKEYHPDSQSPKADVRKFNQIQDAYQVVRSDLEAKNLTDKESGQFDFDIQHTVPQHRQYLEFEGIGMGTPSQRYKHYQTFRTQRAMAAVSERQLEKLLVDNETNALVSLDKKAAKQIKTTNVIDRLVEDLIKDAMNKGEFENLSNTGKPLPDKTRMCPYWDINDHNLNQVLINNGYAPEWIQAEREIKAELRDLKDDLLKDRLKLGHEPLNRFNQEKWERLKDNFGVRIQELNKKVERRNLIVPLLRLQMVHLRPEKEIDKVMKEYKELQSNSCGIDNPQGREGAAKEDGGQFKSDFWAKMGHKIFHKLFFPAKERV